DTGLEPCNLLFECLPSCEGTARPGNLVLDGRQTLRARGDLAAQGLQERPPHEDRQHTGQHDSGNVRASRRTAEEGGHGVLPGAAGKRAPAAAASASATSMVILTSKVTSLS